MISVASPERDDLVEAACKLEIGTETETETDQKAILFTSIHER
jgi:hypothetical protein